MTEEDAYDAAAYIAEKYPDFFDDNETMEKVMYYGYLLEYWEDDTEGYRQFGQDAEQAVKYVYRGVESVEDESTQENLRQLEEDAQRIIY